MFDLKRLKAGRIWLWQHLNFHKSTYLIGIVSCLLSYPVFANSVPGSFIYQGRAFDSGNSPITGTVDIKVQVYDHLGQCLLLSEKHTSLDLTTSSGVFSLQVGSTTGSSVRTAAGDDPGKNVFDVFSNGVALTGLTGTGCGGSYTGSSGNDRILRVTITKDSTDTVLADQNISSVPFSWNAQRVQGKEVLFSDGSSNNAQIISFQNFGSDGARDTAANTASGGSGAQAGQLAFNQGNLQIYTGATWANIPTGSGAGETNTGTSLGGTEAIYSGKSGTALQFKGLTAGSTKIGLTGNANDIEIDVAEANLNLANLGGTLDVASGGTGATTAGGARTNLGIAIGTDVQAYDADLATIGGLSCSNGQILKLAGGVWTCGTDDSGSFGSQTANTVFAAPNGSAGAPSFRALVADDIPALDTGKITSGTMATARLGSGTANSGSFLRGDQTWHAIATSNTLGGGSASDTEIPSQKAVKDYVDGLAGSTYDGAYVNVTGDTMTGPLMVDGSTDAAQLTVQAHSTQTTNLVELQDSAGTDLVVVDGSGNVGILKATPTTPLYVYQKGPGSGGSDTIATFEGVTVNNQTQIVVENSAAVSTLNETWINFKNTSSTQSRSSTQLISGFTDTTDGTRTGFFSIKMPISGTIDNTTKVFNISGSNVGIGDTTPDATFDVEGTKVFLAAPSSDPSATGMAASQITFYLNETGDELHARAMESDGSTSWTTNLSASGGGGASTSGSTTGAYTVVANSDDTGGDGNIIFNVDSSTEAARITAGGNMGIGAGATVDERLVVGTNLGDVGAGENLVIGNSGGNSGLYLGEDTNNFSWMNWNSTSNYLTFGTENASTAYADTLVVRDGKVGVGNNNPSAKVDVSGGAVVARTNVIASGATVNLALGNTHLLKAPGGSAITLQNPVDGGAYTLVVSDTTSRTYTFAGCDNSYFNPTNAATTASSRSTYTILVVVDGANTDCYIAWMSGFQ